MKKNVTAGGVMTELVPVVRPSATIADVEKLLEEKANTFETINYVYAVGNDGRLEGTLSIKNVFNSPGEAKVADVATPKSDIVAVDAHVDREQVALLALRHNIKAVPVIDEAGKFIGVVDSDMIMQILDSEAVEDLLRFGGIYHRGKIDNVMTDSLLTSLKHRLPWLVLGLFGGLMMAGIIGRFEAVVAQHLILAAFIPLLVYMADAVGSQIQAFIIRDLTINPSFKFVRYALRQAAIVGAVATILSVVLYAASWLMYRSGRVSLVVSMALFLAIISSLISGLLIPYTFRKLKFDPANASGPTATIIQDAVSIVVYLAVATMML